MVLESNRDITEHKRSEEQTRSQKVQVELQRRLLEQREQERQQIARDLHDGPIQELTAATLELSILLMDEPPRDVAQNLETIQTTLQAQINELRAYAGELRPPTLAKFGLVKAVQSHLETFQEKHPGVRFQFEEEWLGSLLPEETNLALFRIYQENLTNIVKHSQATQVTIQVTKSLEQVVLEIQDNGVGFTVPDDWLDLAKHGHLGLVGMRERAEAIGGGLEIRSKLGQGTTLRVSVPLKNEPTAKAAD
jgi:two-component system sensor histidine kinase DegS